MRRLGLFLRYGCLGFFLVLALLVVLTAAIAAGTYFYFSRSSDPNLTITIPVKTETGEQQDIVLRLVNKDSITQEQVRQMLQGTNVLVDFTVKGPAGFKLWDGKLAIQIPVDDIIDRVEGRLGEGVPVEDLMRTDPGQAAQELFGAKADMPVSSFISAVPQDLLERNFGKDYLARLRALAGGNLNKTVRQIFQEKPDEILALLKEARRTDFLGDLFDKMSEDTQRQEATQPPAATPRPPR